jgi:Fur family peroxide stress response transcriptional regulator
MRTQKTKQKYKRSRQRERVYELLRGAYSHPTALWLYNKLRKEFPDLSMGTVYRNLRILTEQGLIGKIDFGSTFDRYDAIVSPHYHFICDRCGTITDLAIPVDERLNERVSNFSGHRARRHRIEFFGICESCAAKNDNK